jgi:hypothetical protein
MRCWSDLRKAAREAHLLGAEFRIVGADAEVDGELPCALRAALPVPMLRQYLGAARADKEATTFLWQLGVEPVLNEDIAGADAAMAELSGADPIGIDIETSPPNARPEPVRINRDGSIASVQPKPGDAGLDPHRAGIMTLQLYGGGARAFVFRGAALVHVMNSFWLRQQHLVAHNAGFEVVFLRQHSAPPSEVKARHPVECTMQAAGLLHGVWRRSLAAASMRTLGVEPPKALQTSCWSAPRLSPGQIAYAGADAVLARNLWQEMRPALEAKGRLAAYELQRAAVPAVADMQLRGLGFDLDAHARQVENWSRELADTRRSYQEISGKAPPTAPAEVRAWVAAVIGRDIENWSRTETGELSIERKHLKRLALTAVPTAKPVLAILALQKLISTFGPKLTEFVSPVTGRIHASYHIAGAKSGRFSSSRPNLQQLPSAKSARLPGSHRGRARQCPCRRRLVTDRAARRRMHIG